MAEKCRSPAEVAYAREFLAVLPVAEACTKAAYVSNPPQLRSVILGECYGYRDLHSVCRSSCIERSPAAIARLPQTQFNAQTEIPKVYVLQYASQHVPYHTNATANTVPQGEFLSRFPVPSWISIINLFERYWAL